MLRSANGAAGDRGGGEDAGARARARETGLEIYIGFLYSTFVLVKEAQKVVGNEAKADAGGGRGEGGGGRRRGGANRTIYVFTLHTLRPRLRTRRRGREESLVPLSCPFTPPSEAVLCSAVHVLLVSGLKRRERRAIDGSRDNKIKEEISPAAIPMA